MRYGRVSQGFQPGLCVMVWLWASGMDVGRYRTRLRMGLRMGTMWKDRQWIETVCEVGFDEVESEGDCRGRCTQILRKAGVVDVHLPTARCDLPRTSWSSWPTRPDAHGHAGHAAERAPCTARHVGRASGACPCEPVGVRKNDSRRGDNVAVFLSIDD